MGCSASHPAKFVTHNQNPTSNSSSSFSNSQLQSPFHSSSDPSSTPVSRTLSLPTPLVHHPPLRKGDSNHFVSLTSTTYGSLTAIDSPKPYDSANPTAQIKTAQDSLFSEDSSSPDSVINTWELMEGLDDDDNDDVFNFQTMTPNGFVEDEVSKPLWKHLSEESLLAKMDHNVMLSYQKALLGRRRLKDLLEPQMKSSNGDNLSSLPTKIDHNVRRLKDLLEPMMTSDSDVESCFLYGVEDRIVVYYTSLRGIRKTYEDCCTVRGILRGFSVCVDERDVSMDRSYRDELEDVLKGKTVRLPEVFVRGKYIGGVEEIKELNETGELGKMLQGFPPVDLGCACGNCGDARFVPCPCCNGSRKVYEDGNVRRCSNCNENGLIRCSGCCP